MVPHEATNAAGRPLAPCNLHKLHTLELVNIVIT